MVNYNFGVLDMGLGSRPSQLIFVIFSQTNILAAQNDAVLLSDQINSKKYIFHYISSKKWFIVFMKTKNSNKRGPSNREDLFSQQNKDHMDFPTFIACK